MMDIIDIITAKGWESVEAETFGLWAVHLTDEVAKERYSVSHVAEGRWVIQNMGYERACKLAEALNMRYPNASGKDKNENVQIAAYCQGFASPNGALRRTLSRRAL
jgi:hypothetical protein